MKPYMWVMMSAVTVIVSIPLLLELRQWHGNSIAQVLKEPFDIRHQFICRAAMASLFHRNIEKITATLIPGENPDNVYSVGYHRESDNTNWLNRCYVKGNRVIWSTVAEKGEEVWRILKGDERVYYQDRGGVYYIQVIYADESTTIYKFSGW